MVPKNQLTVQKKDFFIKVKSAWPSDEERDRTKIFIEKFNNKNEEEVTKFCLKSDVVRFACVIEFFLQKYQSMSLISTHYIA